VKPGGNFGRVRSPTTTRLERHGGENTQTHWDTAFIYAVFVYNASYAKLLLREITILSLAVRPTCSYRAIPYKPTAR